jgi:hypothetical protein
VLFLIDWSGRPFWEVTFEQNFAEGKQEIWEKSGWDKVLSQCKGPEVGDQHQLSEEKWREERVGPFSHAKEFGFYFEGNRKPPMYYFSHTLSPVALNFSDRVLYFCQGWTWSVILLPLSPE